MATALFHRDQGDGSYIEYFDDGSVKIQDITTGEVRLQTGPDPQLANALKSGNTSEIERLTQQYDAFYNSKYGQAQLAADQRRQTAAQTALDRASQQQDITNQHWDTNRQDALDARMDSLKLQRAQIAIQQGQAAADLWYKQQLVAQAAQEHSLNVAKLGLDYLTQRSNLRGPQNAFQALDFDYGAKQQSAVPVAFSNLAANLGAPGMHTNAIPTNLSMGGMAAGMGASADVATALNGGSMPGVTGTGSVGQTSQGIAQRLAAAGWSPADVAKVTSIADTYAQGAQKHLTGWQGLTGEGKQDAISGIDFIGGSSPAWLENMQRFTPGQGSAYLA